MAIDSLRKRASIASLGLAFLGPSVVPDSSLAVGDRQTIANSYYGIDSTTSGIDVGGTSQLEAFSATGGVTLEINLGETSQLNPLSATGGVTLEINLGGTSQLAAFTSSGVQVDESEEEDQPTGGWGHFWRSYSDEQERKREARKKAQKARKQAERIESDLDRALALAEREIEEKASRDAELERLTKLVKQHKAEVVQINTRINKVATAAIEKQTYSTMERMERELAQIQEEEEFLLMATEIILNA